MNSINFNKAFFSSLDFLKKNPLRLLLIYTVLIYSPIIYYNFLWDDYVLYRDFLDRDYFDLISKPLDSIFSNHYYPILLLTHKIDFYLSKIVFIDQSDNAHFSYAVIPHITNLILYVGCIYYFYELSKNFFKTNKIFQILSTIIFALHPIHANSISWISGRTDLLATFFSILTLVYLYKLLSNQNFKNLFLSFIFFSLALYSKVIVLTLIGPIVLILLLYIYENKKKIFDQKTSLVFLFLCVVSIVFYLFIFTLLTKHNNLSSLALETLGLKEFLEYFFKINAYYFNKLFLPFNHDVIASSPPEGLELLLSLSIMFLFLVSCFYFLFKHDDFTPIVLFLSILMTLFTAHYSFFRGIEDGNQISISAVAERYAFLPSIFSTTLFVYLLKYIDKKRIAYLAITIVFIFSILVFNRVAVHKDYLTYANATKDKNKKAFHYNVLAQAYNEAGMKNKVEEVYLKAIQHYPKKSRFYIQLAEIERSKGNLEKAQEYIQQGSSLHKDNYKFFYLTGKYFFDQKKYKKSKSYLLNSIRLTKSLENQSKSIILIARIEILNKKYDNAISLLKPLIFQDKKNGDAFFYLGIAHLELKQKQEAIEYLNKAIQLNPKFLKLIKFRD